jgi:exopolysaccharide biosynthesis polyprenyl glycosylphosphotransferase
VRNQRPERLVFVGGGAVTRLLRQRLAVHPEYGIELLGYVDEVTDRQHLAADVVPVLGTVEQFEAIARSHRVERAVIAFGEMTHEHLIEVIRAARRLGVRITIVPRLFEAIGRAVELDEVEGMTLLGLRSLQRTRSSLALKRAIDLVLAAATLTILSPLLLLIAVAIKLSSRGPVLFAQPRVGRDGRHFRMLKFRTMQVGADRLQSQLAHLNELDGPLFKIADDPRVTRFGRLLRRASLDELPQLYNVLRGEMSLVGPRPLVPDESAHVLGRHRDRLHITPGLTGPWQVLGRTAIPFDDMVRLDFLYVAEWSIWSDIKLMVRTAPLVLLGRGV